MRRLWCVAVASYALGCGGNDAGTESAPPEEARSGLEAPVLINSESPVRYPPELYRDSVEGTVILRLYVDETGRLWPESTRVAEGSGHAALDSAALRAVAEFRFAPALREGVPVATAFLQPVQFRQPERQQPGGGL
ncbi:MAG: energy transducer TonB [Gemmatimonadales bacterium]